MMVRVGDASQGDLAHTELEEDVCQQQDIDGRTSPMSPPFDQETTDGDRIGEEDEGPVMEEVGEGSDDSDSSDGRGSHSDGKRPHHTFMNLIAMAIMSSPKKMMVLPEIYDYIQKNFPFYGQMNKRAWQNAVRHNLSLHDCFVKVPRYKVEAPTTSCYWRLSDEARDLHERGESLKRKGAYRRKGGPRGITFRSILRGHTTSMTGGDPYAKQQLLSSSWRLRQPPNGSYPLRLETSSAPQSTPAGKMPTSLDWSHSGAAYGFAPARQRQPYASAPASTRYDLITSGRQRRQETLMPTTRSAHPRGYEARGMYGMAEHRPHASTIAQHKPQPATNRHQALYKAHGDHAKVSAVGRLTFDTRLGLRRFAQDAHGRLCQVETFRSDRWWHNRRALSTMLSTRQRIDMVRELCSEVEEAYEAVAETMRVLAKLPLASESSASTTESAGYPQRQPVKHVLSDHVRAWDGRRHNGTLDDIDLRQRHERAVKEKSLGIHPNSRYMAGVAHY